MKTIKQLRKARKQAQIASESYLHRSKELQLSGRHDEAEALLGNSDAYARCAAYAAKRESRLWGMK